MSDKRGRTIDCIQRWGWSVWLREESERYKLGFVFVCLFLYFLHKNIWTFHMLVNVRLYSILFIRIFCIRCVYIIYVYCIYNDNTTITGFPVTPSLIHPNVWNFSSNLKVSIYIAESSIDNGFRISIPSRILDVAEWDPSFQKTGEVPKKIQLMVQKSQGQPAGVLLKPGVNNGIKKPTWK